MQVKIHDKTYRFLLDTGAGLSVISSSLAEQLAIHPIDSNRLSAFTATGSVQTSPAVIPELKAGPVIFYNQPALIIDSAQLEFRLFEIITLYKIDGILGWPILAGMDIEIDKRNKKLTIRKPTGRTVSESNLFQINGIPTAVFHDATGNELLFNLDTGANHSLLRPDFLKVYPDMSFTSNKKHLWGVGGYQAMETKEIKSFTIYSYATHIEFRNIQLVPEAGGSCNDRIKIIGTLGSNILKTAVVRIDGFNRRLDFFPY